MVHCGSNWSPAEITSYIDCLPTSTRVMRVMTDEGLGYLKAMGNPAGNIALASELVGTELAAWYGLPVFDFSLISVPDFLELPFGTNDGFAETGPAFISREEKEIIPWDGQDILIGHLANKKDVAKLIFFDTWIMNFDRYPPAGSIIPENFDNYLFKRVERGKYNLLVTDHTHCFSEGDLLDDVFDTNLVIDEDIYGYPPKFSEFVTKETIDTAVNALSKIDKNVVASIINSIPNEWGVIGKIKDAWITLIVERAEFVITTLPNKLLKQSEFDF